MTEQNLPVRQVFKAAHHTHNVATGITPGFGPVLQKMRLAKELEGSLRTERFTFFDERFIPGLVGTALLGREPEGVRQPPTQHPLPGSMVLRQKRLIAHQQVTLPVAHEHRVG
ncbi:hypothetical protein D3C81_1993600 [compost metagenome]